jgi:hypothetical protein
LPWWWRQYAPLKSRSTSTWLHGTTSQKTLNFIHSHISSEEWTIGPLEAAVQKLSLTPWHEQQPNLWSFRTIYKFIKLSFQAPTQLLTLHPDHLQTPSCSILLTLAPHVTSTAGEHPVLQTLLTNCN